MYVQLYYVKNKCDKWCFIHATGCVNLFFLWLYFFNGPCKRTQVTTFLRVVCEQCCVCLHEPKSLTGFKLYATSANIVVVPCKRTQHVCPNNVACCWPTMLRPFACASRARPFTLYFPSSLDMQGILSIQFLPSKRVYVV